MKQLFAFIALISLLIGSALVTWALPPLDNVLDELERFRSGTDDIEGEGRLTYGPFTDLPVTLSRVWGEAPRIGLPSAELVGEWSSSDLDVVLRLVGAALSAEDLFVAFSAMGRTVEPRVETLAFIAETPVLVVGGSLDAQTVHIYIERDTFRLRAVDLPMPEGTYRLEMNEYDLADGWFPRFIVVHRDDRLLFHLHLQSVGPV